MANNININPNILNENVDKVVLRPAQLMGKRLREVSENMKSSEKRIERGGWSLLLT